jgi:hypothetical protein
MCSVGVGLPLVVLANESSLQIIGSALITGGIACLLASVGLRLAGDARAGERAREEEEASTALAARLHDARDHSGKYFGGTLLKHRVTLACSDRS